MSETLSAETLNAQSTHDPARQLLRHTLATLAYRAAKTLRECPAGFADFRIGDGSGGTRSPVEILAHMGDLFDWALTQALGQERWNSAAPLPWAQECERFFAVLTKFDDFLASDAVLQRPAALLFQGPIADALTHTGQIAQLRRMAGSPVRGESYARALIEVGRTGADQAPPKIEF